MEIKALDANAEFKAAASKIETLEEALELCKTYGVEITAEELVSAIKKSHSDELSEDDLENVAGGGIKLKVLWWLVKNMPRALYIAWTTEPGKIRQK